MTNQSAIWGELPEKITTIVQQICPAENLAEQPELLHLVQEYYQLVTAPQLSEQDGKRMAAIFELAVYDELLDQCINEIDEMMQAQVPLPQKNKRHCPDSLSLEEFIYQINCVPTNQMTLEKFKSLAMRLSLSEKFLQQYVSFEERDYCRKLICATEFGNIFLISWQPGQSTAKHTHHNELNVIRVLQGELTHRFLNPVSQLYGQTHYQLKQEEKFRANESVCVDFTQSHQLANESEKEAISLHIRFFKQPLQIHEPITYSEGNENNEPRELMTQKRP